MLRLVELVHSILGKHRADDSRSGWISGLSESEGEQYPTAGGLRIGKPVPERKPGEQYDEQFEWERDGQYFHYLTKWMLALNRVGQVTGDPRYNDWAIELAKAAYRGFVYQPRGGGAKRVYWKMNVDLSRPAVPSMGQHDPLDGYITFAALTARELGGISASSALARETMDMRGMCEAIPGWATSDALGIGGLLTEAAHLLRLIASGHIKFDDLLPRLLIDAQRSLQAFNSGRELVLPAGARLAFRELGLSIGLRCLDPMRAMLEQCAGRFDGAYSTAQLVALLESVARFAPLADTIENFWLSADAQESATWEAHLDINSVMLAASLVPDALVMPDVLGSAPNKHDGPAVAAHTN
ncbi:MAG: hypothetical protein ACREJD_00505 [Phycisphaerales bacterium]